MDKKILIVILIIAFLINNYGLKAEEFDESKWAPDVIDKRQIDLAIEQGKEVTSQQFSLASKSTQERYVLGPYADFSDLNQKLVFQDVAIKDVFDILANRENLVRYLSTLSNFEAKKDQLIFEKSANDDISIVNKNKDLFIKYQKSLGIKFDKVIGNFEEYVKDTKEFVTEGSDSTKFSVANLQQLENDGYTNFQIGPQGSLLFYKDGDWIQLKSGEFNYDSNNNLIVSFGDIRSSKFEEEINLYANCLCSARLNKDGSIFITTSKDLLLPSKIILEEGYAILYDQTHMRFGNDVRFDSASFILPGDIQISTPYTVDYFNDNNDHVGNRFSYIQNRNDEELIIATKKGKAIRVRIGVDAEGKLKHNYKLISTNTKDGKVEIIEGKYDSSVYVENGKLDIRGKPKTTILTESGYYTNPYGGGMCSISGFVSYAISSCKALVTYISQYYHGGISPKVTLKSVRDVSAEGFKVEKLTQINEETVKQTLNRIVKLTGEEKMGEWYSDDLETMSKIIDSGNEKLDFSLLSPEAKSKFIEEFGERVKTEPIIAEVDTRHFNIEVRTKEDENTIYKEKQYSYLNYQDVLLEDEEALLVMGGGYYGQDYNIFDGFVKLNGKIESLLKPKTKTSEAVFVVDNNGKVDIKPIEDFKDSDDIKNAIQAGPYLIEDGRARYDQVYPKDSIDYSRGRNAVGILPNGNLIFYSVSDSYGFGASMEDVVRNLLDKGVIKAIAMDGGHSAGLSYRDPNEPNKVGGTDGNNFNVIVVTKK